MIDPFDMIDLFYPSTYHVMKAGPCRVGVCEHEGECGKCKEYGLLRRYAARDTDRINELHALVKELADIVDAPLCHQDCSKCPPDTRCASKRLRALVARAREAIGGAK